MYNHRLLVIQEKNKKTLKRVLQQFGMLGKQPRRRQLRKANRKFCKKYRLISAEYYPGGVTKNCVYERIE